MKVGIIGAGFTGLAAAYRLAKQGIDVLVFEKGHQPGGLAIGFKEKKWKWPLEKYYHHLFVSDKYIRNLATELNHKIFFKKPKTSTFINDHLFQLDSPTSLLIFPKLSLASRIKTAATLFYLKCIASWKDLGGVTSKNFLNTFMGEQSWQILWEPLFKGKFGKYADEISASWFWARIKKRSISLGYPEGGFLSLAQDIGEAMQKHGGKFFYGETVINVSKFKNGLTLTTNKKIYKLDRVISTLPPNVFVKTTKNLPQKYSNNLLSLKAIGAINLVLSLKKQFLPDNSYWLNINEDGFPFLALVEHTNFIDKRNYNNEHIIYIANYLSQDHPYFKKDKRSLLKKFFPYLKKINPKLKKSDILDAYLFKDVFAQPVITPNYSKKIPSLKTPIDNLYMANMQQVYPWDRGTNYAVELGFKVADLVIKSIN